MNPYLAAALGIVALASLGVGIAQIVNSWMNRA